VWTACKDWAGGQVEATGAGDHAGRGMSGTELLVYRCVVMLGMLWTCVWGSSVLARSAAMALELLHI
jgi:hypothetical protein